MSGQSHTEVADTKRRVYVYKQLSDNILVP